MSNEFVLNRDLTFKFLKYSFIAGAGFTLDMIVYYCLIHLNTRIYMANCLSASVGVTFSYFLSVKSVFYYNGSFLLIKFFAYALYSCLSILFFSFLIEYFAISLNNNPIIMKCMVTPFSLVTNFIILGFLLDNKLQYQTK